MVGLYNMLKAAESAVCDYGDLDASSSQYMVYTGANEQEAAENILIYDKKRNKDIFAVHFNYNKFGRIAGYNVKLNLLNKNELLQARQAFIEKFNCDFGL